MKFSINELKLQAVDSPVFFEETVDVSELAELDNNDIRQIKTVEVNGLCTVDKDEFIFSFTISGEMILPCARSLVDVSYQLEVEATEVFKLGDLTELDEENDVHQVTEDIINLKPYIYEQTVLNLPFRVISDTEIKAEGSGWAFYEEDDHKEVKRNEVDPRLAKLQQLLNKDDNTKK